MRSCSSGLCYYVSSQCGANTPLRCLFREKPLQPSLEPPPSTSGRQCEELNLNLLGFRRFLATSSWVASSSAPTARPAVVSNRPADLAASTPGDPTATAANPQQAAFSTNSGAASPHAPPASTPAAPAVRPSYYGLAKRYPNPNSIPENLLVSIRDQLFGKPVQLLERTGRRALARPLQGRVLADWYFLPPAEVPGFHNEEREYQLSKALNRRHRKDEGADGEEAAGGKAGGKKKK